jgi:hypothetical protein
VHAYADSTSTVGYFVGLSHEAISIAAVADSAPLLVPLSTLRRLEMSGRRQHAVLGTIAGAMAGLALGYVIAAGEVQCAESYAEDCLRMTHLNWRPTLIGASTGALLGYYLGSLAITERWADIELPLRQISSSR